MTFGAASFVEIRGLLRGADTKARVGLFEVEVLELRNMSFRNSYLPVSAQAGYEKWLKGRAIAHVKRDKKRGNITATVEGYKGAIHSAVGLSEGRDHYTGESLDWSLVGSYSNEVLKADGRRFKAHWRFCRQLITSGTDLAQRILKSARGGRTMPNTTSHMMTLLLCVGG